MPSDKDGLVASISFQSAPAIAGGRILSAGGSEANTEVSIRARHCWRANQPATVIKPTRFMFQSAPAIAGGRIEQLADQYRKLGVFQSAPAIAGGRIQGANSWDVQPNVSIRARHCWRANLVAPLITRFFDWFQSAPAIAGGRIRMELEIADTAASFNPRPPLLAGESDRVLPSEQEIEFQSAPAIAGGRI